MTESYVECQLLFFFLENKVPQKNNNKKKLLSLRRILTSCVGLTGSQSLTVLSPDAEARRRPLGLNLTAMMGASCPLKVWWRAIEAPAVVWGPPTSTVQRWRSVSCPPVAKRYCLVKSVLSGGHPIDFNKRINPINFNKSKIYNCALKIFSDIALLTVGCVYYSMLILLKFLRK